MLRRWWNCMFGFLAMSMPERWLTRCSDELLRLRHLTQEALRRRSAARLGPLDPSIDAIDGELLQRSILDRNPVWLRAVPGTSGIPGMLTTAEKAYYVHICKFYSNVGEVVELGSWLGLSTHYLLEGLAKNPHFGGRRLHVYDDFIWRSGWMDKWLEGTGIAPPAHHASFLPIFEKLLAPHRQKLNVTQGKLCDYDGNEGLPAIRWQGGPIELMIVDCGRSLVVNEAWWNAFLHGFIPNRTLIVMQDWQNFKRVPELFWENTKIFTDSKGDQLDLIHEVRNAGIATFIYRGGAH